MSRRRIWFTSTGAAGYEPFFIPIVAGSTSRLSHATNAHDDCAKTAAGICAAYEPATSFADDEYSYNLDSVFVV